MHEEMVGVAGDGGRGEEFGVGVGFDDLAECVRDPVQAVLVEGVVRGSASLWPRRIRSAAKGARAAAPSRLRRSDTTVSVP
ncbi:hypothetical protein ACFQV4_01460 [Streptomyces thermocarboxydus]